MEQNEPPKAGNTNAQNDWRTFLIAFLTTVIVLALYHFGTGVFAIFSGKSDYCTIPVAREYVLVPVSAMPQPRMGMMGRGPGGFHHRGGGFHRGEHGGMPRFGKHGGEDMHRHGEHGHGHHPGAPEAPEAPKAAPEAAPKAPAPAPAAPAANPAASR